jgi:hypothetical protein
MSTPGRLAAFFLGFALAAACSDASSPAESGLLPVHDQESVPAGEVEGKLVWDDSCLAIERVEGHSMVVIWPRGTTVAGNEVVRDGKRIASIDSETHLGGGEVEPAVAEDIVGEPLTCESDSYWVAS